MCHWHQASPGRGHRAIGRGIRALRGIFGGVCQDCSRRRFQHRVSAVAGLPGRRVVSSSLALYKRLASRGRQGRPSLGSLSLHLHKAGLAGSVECMPGAGLVHALCKPCIAFAPFHMGMPRNPHLPITGISPTARWLRLQRIWHQSAIACRTNRRWRRRWTPSPISGAGYGNHSPI